MKIILALIFISLVVAIVFLYLFVWSVKSGQYDDTDSPAVRMLMDDAKKDKNEEWLIMFDAYRISVLCYLVLAVISTKGRNL